MCWSSTATTTIMTTTTITTTEGIIPITSTQPRARSWGFHLPSYTSHRLQTRSYETYTNHTTALRKKNASDVLSNAEASISHVCNVNHSRPASVSARQAGHQPLWFPPRNRSFSLLSHKSDPASCVPCMLRNKLAHLLARGPRTVLCRSNVTLLRTSALERRSTSKFPLAICIIVVSLLCQHHRDEHPETLGKRHRRESILGSKLIMFGHR